MKRGIVKAAVFVIGSAWVVLTGFSGASWPVVIVPVVLLLWLASADPVQPPLADLVVQLKVLNERLAVMDDCLRAMDSQLDRHGEQLAHLVDEQLHAMRQRGDIPWPSKS